MITCVPTARPNWTEPVLPELFVRMIDATLPLPTSKILTNPVAGTDELTVAVKVKGDPNGTLIAEVDSVNEVGADPPPPPPPPALLPAPQPRTRHSKQTIPKVVARRGRFRLGQSDRSRMASPSATPSTHQAGGGARRDFGGRTAMNEVEVLEEGGNVVIVSFDEAATPLDILSCEAGLNAQDAPTMYCTLQ